MSDYGGFGGIIKEAQSYEAENRRREQDPIDCPRCGEILKVNARGVRSCPLGHWRSGG